MIKPALTGAILFMVVLAFGQTASDNPTTSSDVVLEKDPVNVQESKNNSTTLALGENSDATGNYSIAIGNGAFANMDNTMVLGGESYDDRVSVGIGTSNPNSLSSLDLADIDKGLLVNRLSTEQTEMFEMALGMADEGMMIYNTTDHVLQTWDGLKWENVQTKRFELKDDQLKLDNGLAVDLSEYQQDLTSATLNGKELTIEIENGSEVKVDLSPLFKEYEDRLAAIEELLSAASISVNEIDSIGGSIELRGNSIELTEAELSQNAPNPFSTSTKIRYTIPEGSLSAYITILNTSGKIVSNQKLSPVPGSREKTIFADGMSPGLYYLALYVDTVKMKTITIVVQ
ncbi:MAG: hypothetical protein HRT57_12210 [Crocinitomicaceae bacterium]|nr:hypothetical protein [Crocinitomicaceae bacterium]